MRNHLVRCLEALFVGMILGLLFVTLVHASPVRIGRTMSPVSEHAARQIHKFSAVIDCRTCPRTLPH